MEMTNEQKAQDLFKEWHKTHYIDSDPEDMIAFAAFCLDKREKETGWRKYPEQKPDKDGCYLGILKGIGRRKIPDGFWTEVFWDNNEWTCPEKTEVIAFLPIPEYNP